VRVAIGDGSIALPIVAGEFPDPDALLDALAAGGTRLVADRTEVLELLTTAVRAATIELAGAAGLPTEVRATMRADGEPPIEQALHAEWRGPAFRVAFDRAVLAAAVEAGVGPDVMLELAPTPHPAVVRSADQGSLTTLVMPRPLLDA
jgi:hypothetical protein